METKSLIRKQILEKRKALPFEAWENATKCVMDRVIRLEVFRRTRAVYTYVDAKNEVGTREFINCCLRLGKRVAVPKVTGRFMGFYEISSLRELEPASFGLMEPKGQRKAADEDALLIVPGVAFDKQCHRIGYGGGYYDRYLAAHPHVNTVAVAFSFQVLEEIPHEPHDFKPRMLVTETGIYGAGTDGRMNCKENK